MKLSNLKGIIFPKEEYSSQINFLSKDLLPIYASFFVFAIIYSYQYIYYGLWTRIIFAVVIGGGTLGILFLTRNKTKYRQISMTLFFMVNIVLLDQLVMFNLKISEMFLIGVYESVFFFYMIKGSSVFCSSLGFSFMLIYFSFTWLDIYDDLITIFANFTICFLEGYLISLNQKIYNKRIKDKLKEREKMHYLLDKIFPGISIMIKLNDSNLSDGDLLNIFDKNSADLELINQKGKNKYGLKNLEDLQNFCKKIRIVNNTSNSFVSEIDDKLYVKTFEDILNSIIVYKNIDVCHCFKGITEFSEYSFKISLSNYYWDHSAYLIIYIDDENFETQIKTLKENDTKKNELLASVTHDLRSPLNGMLAFIKTAKECDEEEKRNEFLSYAEINAHLLLSLINDILDYSSFVNNKLKLSEDQFKCLTIVQEISSLMSIQASFKNLKFIIQNCLPENLILFSDSRRIKQILINLIGNSIKFTLKGEIKLKVKNKSDPSLIEFIVSDTGVGIPPSHISKLCQPYATFDSKEGLNKEGIGLGLNICKKLISLLGPTGDLIINSQEGKGTKIKFKIFKNLKSKYCKSTYSELDFKIPPKKKTRSRNFSNLSNLTKKSSAGESKFKKTLEQKKLQLASLHFQEEKNDFQSNMILDLQSFNFLNSSTNSCKIHSIPVLSINRKSNLEVLQNACEIIFPSEDEFQIKSSATISDNEITKLNVLLVDDNPFNCLVLSNYLKKMKKYDISYESVSNGLECVSKFKEKNVFNLENNEKNSRICHTAIQIIILDCLMPIKNGYEAAQEISSLLESGNYYDVYIIGNTALSCEDEEQKCLDCGMDFLLEKPIFEKDLFQLIEKIVKNIYQNLLSERKKGGDSK